jgi:hypothetical protein
MSETRRDMGYLPDIPKIEDYDENHPKVAQLLNKTALGSRVAGTAKSTGSGGGSAKRHLLQLLKLIFALVFSD